MSETVPGEKLQKILAQLGLGSRREMEKVIAAGRVTVNGQKAKLGDRAGRKDEITLDGQPLHIPVAAQGARVLIYNKPEAEICSRKDPEGRRSVFDSLPKLKNGRWISIGRLDYNTTGLLLFTTDGELAHKLMHPSSNIDREYLCRVLGKVDQPMLTRLKEGVLLEDGVAKFTDVVDGGGEGANHWYYVALMEGRNREVRRLWESQDIQVNRLKRVRFGKIFLPSKLKQSQWMEMPYDEIKLLYKMVEMVAPKPAKLNPEERKQLAREQRKGNVGSRARNPKSRAIKLRNPRGKS
jgi:23S rRNA pseudouridine2605 synthase